MDIGKAVGGVVVAALAFALSFRLTGKGCGDKLKSYLACVCITYALSVGVAEVAGAPLEAGDVIESTRQTVPRDVPGWSWKKKVDLSRFIFWVSIAPAMIGVYCAYRSPDEEGPEL